MRYKFNKLTVNIDISEGEFTGDCSCEIPFSHKEFITSSCGMSKNINFRNNNFEHIFSHSYGEIFLNYDRTAYYVSSPDMIIMYISWLLSEEKEVEINVTYPNAFWLIHDIQHSIYDEAGCSIYVDAEIEKERLLDALKIMKEEEYFIDYELLEEIEKAYKDRFDKELYLSYEDFIEMEEESL